MSNGWGSLALLIGLAFALPASACRTILGIQGLAIGDDEYVAGFDLAYDGWYVLAVCRVLPDSDDLYQPAMMLTLRPRRLVMPTEVGIHAFLPAQTKAWMAGLRPP